MLRQLIQSSIRSMNFNAASCTNSNNAHGTLHFSENFVSFMRVSKIDKLWLFKYVYIQCRLKIVQKAPTGVFCTIFDQH